MQVVTFRLAGIARADYDALCERIAPAIAAVPGLVALVWLADESTNTFGGVYTWRDRAALESFLKSDLFRSIATHPHLVEMTSRVFSIVEAPSAITSFGRPVAA
jgi:quinol monooxygenase YgiN